MIPTSLKIKLLWFAISMDINDNVCAKIWSHEGNCTNKDSYRKKCLFGVGRAFIISWNMTKI